MLVLLVPCLTACAIFLFFMDSGVSLKRVQGFALKIRILQVFTFFSQMKLLQQLQKVPGWAVVQKEVQKKAAEHALQLTEEQSLGACIALLFFASLGVSVCVGNVLFLPLVFPVLTCLIYSAGKYILEQKKQSVQNVLPDAYRSLAGSISSGQTLPQAMRYVGRHVSGEVGNAFKEASLTFQCGGSISESLSTLERRLQDSSCELLICALSVSQKTGAPLAELLYQAAELVEEKESLKKLLQTKTAQVRMSVQVVMLLPVVLVVGLTMLSPDFQRGLLTPLGIMVIGMAAALDIAALCIMKRIVKGVSIA